jgi:hypothetical protein
MITNAKRSTPYAKMQQLLQIKNAMTDWDEAFDESPQLERHSALVTECGDLIVLAYDEFKPVHSSLNEYLTTALITIDSLKD